MNKQIIQAIAEVAFISFIVALSISAIGVIFATSGRVYGTEFVMLIKLVNVVNKILVLWCLRIILRWIFPDPMNFSEIIQILKSIQIRIDNKA